MSAKASKRGGQQQRFGLIGYPLEHSLSPFIHQSILDAAELPGRYELFEVRPENLEQMLPRILRHLDGFNCTIPHKEAIPPYLTRLDESAKQYGAVNTVFRQTGYNTDGFGFRQCGIPMSGQRVLLLGAGGVSRMMAFEAARAGAASLRILARGIEKARRLAEDVQNSTGVDAGAVLAEDQIGSVDVLLNGTPLGMWPLVRGVPIGDTVTGTVPVVFDSVYNPAATRLLLQAKTGGADVTGGLLMLFGQALAAQKIWHPDGPWEETSVRNALAAIPPLLSREQIRRHPVKYVMTGFMASGKSTVGRMLAERIGVEFVDLDGRIREQAGKNIEDIFREDGEAAFRIREGELLREALTTPVPAVISTGGGALLQPDAMLTVTQTQSLVIFLDVELKDILDRVNGSSGRPLMDNAGPERVRALFDERRPLYRERADLVVDGTALTAQQLAEQVADALGYGGDVPVQLLE